MLNAEKVILRKEENKNKKLQLKIEKQEALEESFRRERNKRWAAHKGIEDVTKWYDEGNRMPYELELMAIQLKMDGYLLSEIFEIFDKRDAKAAERAKVIQYEDDADTWFETTLKKGGRLCRPEVYRRATEDGVQMVKKDFFKLLEEKCGKPFKCNGNVCFRGWSLVEPT
jgi:hypothetical protein